MAKPRLASGGKSSGPTRLSERHAKILIAMYHRSGGASKPLKYEDIVVEAFRRFPENFQLRGYPEYPDASDIHKPLYGPLSNAGFVTGANKQFRLTALGLSTAQHLLESEGALRPSGTAARVSRDAEAEIQRLRSTRAFNYYTKGRASEVVDSDFYSFFKVSVRTKPHEFVGRLSAARDTLKAANEAGQDVADIEETRRFLLRKYRDIIQEITGSRWEEDIDARD